MVRDYRERHFEKDGAWVSSWKQEEWKWMKDGLGAYSKHSIEATDENDLDLAISVFRVGTHSDNEEEDRSDRVGTYRGIRAAR